MPVFGFLVVLAFLQGMFALSQFPYYLTYYNPLVGGIHKAEDVLMVGWGEGLDQAADWIDEQPGADQSQVVSWYGAGPFSYYMDNKRFPLWFWDPDFWFEADYAVTYINQWQREIPDRETIAFFDSLEPIHTISLNGLEMARIYDLRNVPPPEFTNISTASAGQCSDDFALSAHRQDRDSLLPGESTNVTLFLKTLSPLEQQYQLVARLSGDDDVSIWQSEQEIGIPADLLSLIQIEHIELDIAIPPDAAAGEYTLSIACVEPESNGAVSDAFIDVTTLTVLPVSVVDLEATWAEFGLETLRHQPRVQQGNTLTLALSASGKIDGSAKISMRLVDANGEKIAQQDKALERNMEFALNVPNDLTPDQYDIAVIIYDPETLGPIPDVAGSEIVLLSTVEVVPR